MRSAIVLGYLVGSLLQYVWGHTLLNSFVLLGKGKEFGSRVITSVSPFRILIA